MLHRVWLLSVGLLLFPACPWAQSGAVLEVGKFSASQVGLGLPDGWKPLTFKKIPKHTSYEVVKDGGMTIVKAVSEAHGGSLEIEPRAQGGLDVTVRLPAAPAPTRSRARAGTDSPGRDPDAVRSPA